MKRLTLLIALMLMLTQASAFAQISAVPPMMNFQGRLANPDGTPVADGTYSLRFSFWTAANGGTEKWNQTIHPVIVKNGTFAVQLNTSTEATDKFHNNLWLEIKVGTDAPLTPRQPLASVAYAFKADSVPDGSITSNSLADNAVTSAKIADNAVTNSKLANGSITGDKLDSSLQGMLGGFDSNKDHAVLVSSVETGGVVRAVAASGNYAYVLGFATNKTLKIYDVSDPTKPTFKGSAATGSGPRAIAVSGNYAYVLTLGTGLEIYDVSNPAAPTRRGVIATGSTPTSIAVSGNYAYVVNFNSHNLQIVNVSNPDAPTLQGSVATGTGPHSVALSGNHAIVVSVGSASIQSYDVSDPSAPVARGTAGTRPNPVFVTTSGNYAYVCNSETSGPFQVYDISNPAAPAFVNNIVTGDYPVCAAVNNNRAFVLCSGSQLFQVLDVGSPLTPRYTDRVSLVDSPMFVTVSDTHAYVVDRTSTSGTLKIFAINALTVNNNILARGGGFFHGSLNVDLGDMNQGNLTSGLTFGNVSGEGIASKRTYGGNQWGLDFYTAYQNRMSITNNGFVGIGTTTPTVTLDVNGIVASPFFFTTSDARYKQNVATLENPLDAILSLRGVTYDWKQKEFPDRNFPTGRQIGFLAQEVEKVLPELVYTNTDGYKSVAYQNVVPVLVEAVKTQQTQYEKSLADIKALQTEVAELKALVLRLTETQRAGQK